LLYPVERLVSPFGSPVGTSSLRSLEPGPPPIERTKQVLSPDPVARMPPGWTGTRLARLSQRLLRRRARTLTHATFLARHGSLRQVQFVPIINKDLATPSYFAARFARRTTIELTSGPSGFDFYLLSSLPPRSPSLVPKPRPPHASRTVRAGIRLLLILALATARRSALPRRARTLP